MSFFLRRLRVFFWLGCLGVALGAEGEPARLRVMTWNIHHGEGIDGRLDVGRIAALIQRQRVDIVALQEVDRGVERTEKRDLLAELAQATGMHAAFGKNIDHQGGDYGNGVLSRHPIVSATNRHYRVCLNNEQRGLQQVAIGIGDRRLQIWNTHLDFHRDPEERLACVAELKEWVRLDRGRKGPVLLTGDLNALPGSPTLESLKPLFRDAWSEAGIGEGFTVPVRKPSRRIDYLLPAKVGGDELEVKSIRVLSSEASDHLPVLAEFVWKN